MRRVLPLLFLVALAGSACAPPPEPVPTGAYTTASAETSFYFSEGRTGQPAPVTDALVAHTPSATSSPP